MKKNFPFIIIAMLILLVFTGCPYESAVPLGDPQKSVMDHDILGRWVNIRSNPSGSNDTLLIMKFNDHEYYIESHAIKNGKIKTERTRGFTTLIRNQKVLNITDLNEPGKYVFARYEIKGEKMVASSPTDNFIKESFSSSHDLFEFFKKNMDKEGFYEEADTLIKIK